MISPISLSTAARSLPAESAGVTLTGATEENGPSVLTGVPAGAGEAVGRTPVRVDWGRGLKVEERVLVGAAVVVRTGVGEVVFVGGGVVGSSVGHTIGGTQGVGAAAAGTDSRHSSASASSTPSRDSIG